MWPFSVLKFKASVEGQLTADLIYIAALILKN